MKSQPIFRQKCALHVVTSHDIFYSFCPCLLAAYQYTLTTIVLLINRDALVVSKTATKICKLAKATYPSSKDNSDANGNTFYVPLGDNFRCYVHLTQVLCLIFLSTATVTKAPLAYLSHCNVSK